MSVSAGTAAWLDALYCKCTADDGNLVFIAPNRKEIHTVFPLGNQRVLVEAADVLSGEAGLYLKINPMDAEVMRQRAIRTGKGHHITGRADEVKTIVSFHLDVDAGKSDKYLGRDKALKCLNKMPHKPSLIINSDGPQGGFHSYWILAQPHRIKDDDDRKRISEAANRWQQRLNKLADGKLDSTADICRVLRVVGLPRLNGNIVSCLHHWPRRLYTLDDLTIPPTMAEIAAAAKQSMFAKLSASLGPVASDNDIESRAVAYVGKMPPSISGQNGHDRCFAAACVLVLGFNLSTAVAHRILVNEFNPRCDPKWSTEDLTYKVNQADDQPGDRGYLIDARKAG